MLAYISVAMFVVLSCEGVNSNTFNAPQFDVLFPHDPAELSFVTTEDSYKMPGNIRKFTFCFWVKPSADTLLTILSYNSYPPEEYSHELGFELHAQAVKFNWLRLSLLISELKIEVNAWQHFCVFFGGNFGNFAVFCNGSLVFKQCCSRVEKYEIRGGGVFVLGQHQDTDRTGFYPSRSMRGRLSRFQMWDRMLNDDEVKQQMECDAPEGNIISWTQTPWVFNNGAKKVLSDICPANFSEDTPAAEADSSECECSGTKMADLKKTFFDAKTEILPQLTDLKEKIGHLEENNGVLTNAINLLQKNIEDILDVKRRSEVLERKLDKMLLYFRKNSNL